MMRVYISLFVVFFMSIVPGALAAQVTGVPQPLILTFAPEFPRPGDLVELAVHSNVVDLERSQIVWTVNGEGIESGFGATKATVLAGTSGTLLDITVTAHEEEEPTALVSGLIRPSTLDILWNADSYTPPFYRGRTLSGSHSLVRAHALAKFQSGSQEVPENKIVYTWKRNGTILFDLSGIGKSSAILEGPPLHGSILLTVEAESLDSVWKNIATTSISNIDPFLTLHENHPLFGVLYHRAMVGDVGTSEAEQKVTAVPYFAHTQTPSDASLAYEWIVNERYIAPDLQEPQTLTITAEGYRGPATIELSLTNSSDIFMRAKNIWRLVFSENGADFFSRGIFGE